MRTSEVKPSRWSIPMLRVAAWTLRARVAARKSVFKDGIASSVAVPAPPAAPIHATSAVIRVLGLTRATCLVRSLVLQQWYADHGEPVDVVIGVTSPSSGFRAHAWLDRANEEAGEEFVELHRIAPRPVSQATPTCASEWSV